MAPLPYKYQHTLNQKIMVLLTITVWVENNQKSPNNPTTKKPMYKSNYRHFILNEEEIQRKIKIFENNPDLLLKSMVKLVQPHYGYSFKIKLTPHSLGHFQKKLI